MTPILRAAAVEMSPSPVSGAVRAPSSKSLANRALVVACLADGTSRLGDVEASDDVTAMRDAVAALGADVRDQGPALVVTGTGGRIAADKPVHARASGTTLRFVTAVAALSTRPVTVTGEPGLLRRPVGALTAALRVLGAEAADHDGFPPVTVGGGLQGGVVTVDVSASSQFASALLLAAPHAASDVTVTASGAAARDYVEMTADLMRRWGVAVSGKDQTWTVPAGTGYVARAEAIEYDASAAAHLYALAAAAGGSVTVTNAAATTLQPDARLPDVLATMGCEVHEEEGAVSVTGPGRGGLTPVDVDLTEMPDQVTTVAALAALADGDSTISGVAVTRGHETDRLAALALELGKLGVAVDERPDGLVVHGGRPVASAPLGTHGDHRLAMAFAAVGLAVPGVVIEDPGCVAKTYPRFWDDVRLLGGSLRVAG